MRVAKRTLRYLAGSRRGGITYTRQAGVMGEARNLEKQRLVESLPELLPHALPQHRHSERARERERARARARERESESESEMRASADCNRGSRAPFDGNYCIVRCSLEKGIQRKREFKGKGNSKEKGIQRVITTALADDRHGGMQKGGGGLLPEQPITTTLHGRHGGMQGGGDG